MTQEQQEIIDNARAAYRAKEITREELHDVYYIIAREIAETALEAQ